MKKALTLLLALGLTMSLAACGGADDSAGTGTTDSGTSATTPPEVKLVSKEANFTTMLVPSDFGEFRDQDGYAIAEGVGCNIVVTPTVGNPSDSPATLTQEYFTSQLESSYSNIKVLAYDNAATVAGVDAVCFQFTGDGKTNGTNKTVCLIAMFFTLEGQACEQQVTFTYDTGANTALEASLKEIIDSISLE